MVSLEYISHGIRDLITEQSEAAVGFTIPMIAGMVPAIAEAFARVIANDPQKRDLLVPAVPFDGSIVNGVYDLAPNLIAPDRLLLDFIQTAEIRKSPDDLGTAFHWVRHPSQLAFKRPTDPMFVSCAVDGSVLYTRNTDGALDADIGDITISGPFIPIIHETAASTTLPFALVGDFTTFGARFILGYVASHGKR